MPRSGRNTTDGSPPRAAAGRWGGAECRRFLREYEAFHTELRERDPEAWAELEQERREFDGTLMDGLEDE